MTRQLATELRRRGHDVTVVANRYPRSLKKHEVVDGIPVVRRLYPNLLPSPGRRSWVAVAKQILSLPLGALEIAYLTRLVKRLRPDVVNVHYLSYPAAYALIAARLAGVPVVLCFHGSDVPAVPYPASYGWAADLACTLAEKVICCSENLRRYLTRDLSSLGISKTSVSHYGIDAVSGEPQQTVGVAGAFILLPARLVDKKAVDVAIRAMGQLRDWSVSTQLVVLGDGPLRSVLERLADDLGVAERVHFLGSIDHASARRITADALFVIVPSRWEAFGMVCLEAMIAGKAVVGTRNGGISEIVVDGETGLLVPPDDPVELAKAIRALLDDRERADKMGSSGRERALKHFTWDQMLDRYEDVFCQAVDRPSDPKAGAGPPTGASFGSDRSQSDNECGKTRPRGSSSSQR